MIGQTALSAPLPWLRWLTNSLWQCQPEGHAAASSPSKQASFSVPFCTRADSFPPPPTFNSALSWTIFQSGLLNPIRRLPPSLVPLFLLFAYCVPVTHTCPPSPCTVKAEPARIPGVHSAPALLFFPPPSCCQINTLISSLSFSPPIHAQHTITHVAVSLH